MEIIFAIFDYYTHLTKFGSDPLQINRGMELWLLPAIWSVDFWYFVGSYPPSLLKTSVSIRLLMVVKIRESLRENISCKVMT